MSRPVPLGDDVLDSSSIGALLRRFVMDRIFVLVGHLLTVSRPKPLRYSI
jgi:hypothetical protein